MSTDNQIDIRHSLVGNECRPTGLLGIFVGQFKASWTNWQFKFFQQSFYIYTATAQTTGDNKAHIFSEMSFFVMLNQIPPIDISHQIHPLKIGRHFEAKALTHLIR